MFQLNSIYKTNSFFGNHFRTSMSCSEQVVM